MWPTGEMEVVRTGTRRLGRGILGKKLGPRLGARPGESMVTMGEKISDDGSWVGEDTGAISEGYIVGISRGSGRKFSGEN